MLNVAEEAKQWFEENGEDFAATVLRCLFFGHLIRRGNFLLLTEEVLAYPDTGVVAMGENCPKNCWFIYYLGHQKGCYGPLDYMAEAPFPHRYVAYKRRGRIVVRDWEKLKKDIVYGRSTASTSP